MILSLILLITFIVSILLLYSKDSLTILQYNLHKRLTERPYLSPTINKYIKYGG